MTTFILTRAYRELSSPPYPEPLFPYQPPLLCSHTVILSLPPQCGSVKGMLDTIYTYTAKRDKAKLMDAFKVALAPPRVLPCRLSLTLVFVLS